MKKQLELKLFDDIAKGICEMGSRRVQRPQRTERKT